MPCPVKLAMAQPLPLPDADGRDPGVDVPVGPGSSVSRVKDTVRKVQQRLARRSGRPAPGDAEGCASRLAAALAGRSRPHRPSRPGSSGRARRRCRGPAAPHAPAPSGRRTCLKARSTRAQAMPVPPDPSPPRPRPGPPASRWPWAARRRARPSGGPGASRPDGEAPIPVASGRGHGTLGAPPAVGPATGAGLHPDRLALVIHVGQQRLELGSPPAIPGLRDTVADRTRAPRRTGGGSWVGTRAEPSARCPSIGRW